MNLLVLAIFSKYFDAVWDVKKTYPKLVTLRSFFQNFRTNFQKRKQRLKNFK